MGMGDENGLDPLALDRREDRGEVGVVAGARIDHGDFALADDIGAGAVEGEGRGVRRDEAAHERGKAGQRARRRLPRIGEEFGFLLVSHSRTPSPPRLRRRLQRLYHRGRRTVLSWIHRLGLEAGSREARDARHPRPYSLRSSALASSSTCRRRSLSDLPARLM